MRRPPETGVEVHCPACHHLFTKRVAPVPAKRTFTCPSCGADVPVRIRQTGGRWVAEQGW